MATSLICSRCWSDCKERLYERYATHCGDSCLGDVLIEARLLTSRAPIAIAKSCSDGEVCINGARSRAIWIKSLVNWHRNSDVAKLFRYKSLLCVWTCRGNVVAIATPWCGGVYLTNLTLMGAVGVGEDALCGQQILLVWLQYSHGKPPWHCRRYSC